MEWVQKGFGIRKKKKNKKTPNLDLPPSAATYYLKQITYIF